MFNFYYGFNIHLSILRISYIDRTCTMATTNVRRGCLWFNLGFDLGIKITESKYMSTTVGDHLTSSHWRSYKILIWNMKFLRMYYLLSWKLEVASISCHTWHLVSGHLISLFLCVMKIVSLACKLQTIEEEKLSQVANTNGHSHLKDDGSLTVLTRKCQPID